MPYGNYIYNILYVNNTTSYNLTFDFFSFVKINNFILIFRFLIFWYLHTYLNTETELIMMQIYST